MRSRRRTRTRSADELLADLRVDRGLAAARTTPHALIAPRLAPLMRAVQVFGFHLATVDLRQSSDKHEAVVAELLRVARIEPDYAALRRGRAARAAAAPAQRRAAAARARRRLQRARARASSRSSRPRARCSQRYGREAMRHYIISHTEDVSDLLEVLLLQKEVGPDARHARRRRARPT